MNFRKLSLSALAIFLGIFITTNYSLAINIESRPINNVEVSFIPSENEGILNGKVWGNKQIPEASKMIVELVDTNQAVIISNEIEVATKKDKNFSENFTLKISEYNLSGDYTIKARVLDKNNLVLSFGEKKKLFESKNTENINSSIANLVIRSDKELVSGSVGFLNNDLDGEFTAKIDIYRDDTERKYVGTFNSEKVFVKSGEEKEITFSFDSPAEPQIYEAEVSIMQKGKEITGKLTKQFLIKGDFGEFYKIKIGPEKYIKKGETITVEFTGATTTKKDQVLSVEIDLTDNNGFSAKKFVNVSPESLLGGFEGKEVFLATKGVSQIVANISLWNGNDELAKISKSTELFKKPENENFISKIKEIKTGVKLSSSDRYKIILILTLIVLAIIIFIRGLVRSSKSKNFFIFFCLIIISGAAFASSPTGTLYPANGIGYNSNSESGFFNKIGFWGYLFNPLLGGYFPITNETINYEVTISNGIRSIIVPGTFTNKNSYEYKFNVNVPSELEDGTYIPSIRFFGSSIENRLADLGILETDGSRATEINLTLSNIEGNPIKIIIDSKSPNQTFTFKKLSEDVINDGEFINEQFTNTPVCGDAGVGCYAGGDSVYTAFNTKGNFCDSSLPVGNTRTFCGAIHEFKVCDIVGNCNTQSVDIDFYDPVAPVTLGGDFIQTEGANVNSIFDTAEWEEITAVEANQNPTQLSGSFNSNNVLSGVSISPENIYSFGLRGTNDPRESTSEMSDSSACEQSNDFYVDNGMCVEKEVVCALSPYDRGISTKGEGCTVICPPNFNDLDGNGICEPECYYDKFPYCFDLII